MANPVEDAINRLRSLFAPKVKTGPNVLDTARANLGSMASNVNQGLVKPVTSAFKQTYTAPKAAPDSIGNLFVNTFPQLKTVKFAANAVKNLAETSGPDIAKGYRVAASGMAPLETAAAGLIQNQGTAKQRVQKAFAEGQDLVSAFESKNIPGALPLGIAASVIIPGAGELTTGLKKGVTRAAAKKTISENALKLLNMAANPEDALNRLRVLEDAAINTGKKLNMYGFKDALKTFRKSLVTGPGLPQEPTAVPIIDEIDRILVGGARTKKVILPSGAEAFEPITTKPIITTKQGTVIRPTDAGVTVIPNAEQKAATTPIGNKDIVEWQRQLFKQEGATVTKKQQLNKMTNTIGRAIRENTTDGLPTIDDVAARPRKSPQPIIDFIKSTVTSSRKMLQDMGTYGKSAADKIDQWYSKYRLMAGDEINQYTKVIKGLPEQSIEKINQALDGIQVQLTPEEQTVFSRTKEALDRYGAKAQGARIEITLPSGEKVPFSPRENFLPHFLDTDKLAQNRDLTINHLVSTGQLDLENATAFIDDVLANKQVGTAYHRYFPNALPQKYGHLEMARVIDWPKEVIRYDKGVIADYLESAARRISQAEVFGPNNELIEKIMKGISAEGGNTELTQRIFDQNFGKIPKNTTDRALDAARGLMSAAKLPLAAISNLSQSVNTATEFGITNTLKAMAESGNQKAIDFADKTGTILDATMRSIQDEISGGGGLLRKVTAPGFAKVERFNRIVASNAGKYFVQDTLKKLMADPTNATYQKDLLRMGINYQDALKSGVTEQDLLKAGQKAVDLTQFKVDPIDMPPSWNSSVGKFFTQFKQFAFKQAGFVWNRVVKEAAKGNLAPMSRYLLLGSIVGEGVNDVKALIKGKERTEKTPAERIGKNISAVGGFGVAQDAITALTSNYQDAIPNFIFGPSVQTGIDTLQAVGKLKEGNVEPLAKQAVSLIPVVGSIGVPRLFPSDAAKYPTGAKMVVASTPQGRTKQKSQITEKLNTAKGVTRSELDFAYLYDGDKIQGETNLAKQTRLDEYIKAYNSAMADDKLTENQKKYLATRIAEKTGLAEDQLAYYNMASKNSLEKWAFIQDKLATATDTDQAMKFLIAARTDVNGKQLLDSAAVDKLVSSGAISEQEGKELKALTLDSQGLVTKAKKVSGKKPKKLKISSFKSKTALPKNLTFKPKKISVRTKAFAAPKYSITKVRRA